MLIKIFKKNYHIQILLFLVLPLIIWVPALINPPELVVSKYDMSIYQIIHHYLQDLMAVSTVIALVLVYIQGLVINSILSHNQLFSKTSFLPGLIYILLLSSNYSSMTLSSFLIANTFTLISILFIFKSYDKRDGVDEVFNSSLFIALASLTFSPSLIFILWIWLSLLSYKSYKWRLWIISILGLITPFILLGALYFIMDMFVPRAENYILSFASLPNFETYYQPVDIVYYVGIAILAIASILNMLISLGDSTVSFRKKTSVMILFFFVGLLPSLYLFDMQEIIIFSLPATAYFVANFLYNKKKLFHANMIFTALLLLIALRFVLSYYGNIFIA